MTRSRHGKVLDATPTIDRVQRPVLADSGSWLIVGMQADAYMEDAA